MGTSTSAARVGSFLSPYIVYSVSLALVDEGLIVFLMLTCLWKRNAKDTYIKLLILVDFLLHLRTLYFQVKYFFTRHKFYRISYYKCYCNYSSKK